MWDYLGPQQTFPGRQIYQCKIISNFLSISLNICFGCSKELTETVFVEKSPAFYSLFVSEQANVTPSIRTATHSLSRPVHLGMCVLAESKNA